MVVIIKTLVALTGIFLTATTAMASAHSHSKHHLHHARQASSGPAVFAHYMLITSPPNNDYTNDIRLAQSTGIDAFAVNYGGWNCNWTQLDSWLQNFYDTAQAHNFSLFISYDTTAVDNASMIVDLANTYATHPAQLLIDNKVVLSSFSDSSPAWNWQTDVLDKINHPTLFLPGTLCASASEAFSQVPQSGPFTWIHPTASVDNESDFDNAFSSQRSASQPWMAGIAPWFFKRMGEDMNWLHGQDSGIWVDRWLSLLKLKPDFIEIVTWNDFGESSYIGPVDSLAETQLATTDLYYAGLDHSAFLAMSKIFIKAYKAGLDYPDIEDQDEDVFMFYRLQPALTNGAQDTLPLPLNASDIADNVYVVSFLNTPATVTLSSGSNSRSLEYPSGVAKGYFAGFDYDTQHLSLDRELGDGSTLNKTGPAIQAQFDKYQGNVVAI